MLGEYILKFKKFFVVGKENDCWIWKGTIDVDGYGSISIHGRPYKAHRIMYILYNFLQDTNLINDLCVCHTCDVPLCVNPKHLFLGTIRDNQLDKIKKHRNKHFNEKLTDEQSLKIFNDYRPTPEICKDFCICARTVYNIKHRKKRWKNLF